MTMVGMRDASWDAYLVSDRAPRRRRCTPAPRGIYSASAAGRPLPPHRERTPEETSNSGATTAMHYDPRKILPEVGI